MRHGETGYLIEGRDPTDYASAIDLILSSPEHASALGAAAAAVASRYPWSGLASRLQRIYADLIAESSPIEC